MATGAYDANGIWQYGEDDNIALFSDLLNLGTESTSDAFTDDRARLATLEAGSLAGLIPVKPTSVVVAGGTAAVNTIGVVTVTGCSVTELRGCFSSRYQNYRIIVRGSHTTATESRIRLMSGSTAITSLYTYSGYYAVPSSGGAFIGATSDSQLEISWNGVGAQGGVVIDILNPYASTFTHIMSTHAKSDGQSQQRNGTHTANNSYDGLYLFESTGTFTGTVQVFGYNS